VLMQSSSLGLSLLFGKSGPAPRLHGRNATPGLTSRGRTFPTGQKNNGTMVVKFQEGGPAPDWDSLALESGGVPGLTRGENIPDCYQEN
jgi:hypothetical protein